MAEDAEPGDITITQRIDDDDQFYVVRRQPDLKWLYRHVDDTDWQALTPENGALYNAAVRLHDEGQQVGRARMRRTFDALGQNRRRINRVGGPCHQRMGAGWSSRARAHGRHRALL